MPVSNTFKDRLRMFEAQSEDPSAEPSKKQVPVKSWQQFSTSHEVQQPTPPETTTPTRRQVVVIKANLTHEFDHREDEDQVRETGLEPRDVSGGRSQQPEKTWKQTKGNQSNPLISKELDGSPAKPRGQREAFEKMQKPSPKLPLPKWKQNLPKKNPETSPPKTRHTKDEKPTVEQEKASEDRENDTRSSIEESLSRTKQSPNNARAAYEALIRENNKRSSSFGKNSSPLQKKSPNGNVEFADRNLTVNNKHQRGAPSFGGLASSSLVVQGNEEKSPALIQVNEESPSPTTRPVKFRVQGKSVKPCSTFSSPLLVEVAAERAANQGSDSLGDPTAAKATAGRSYSALRSRITIDSQRQQTCSTSNHRNFQTEPENEVCEKTPKEQVSRVASGSTTPSSPPSVRRFAQPKRSPTPQSPGITQNKTALGTQSPVMFPLFPGKATVSKVSCTPHPSSSHSILHESKAVTSSQPPLKNIMSKRETGNETLVDRQIEASESSMSSKTASSSIQGENTSRVIRPQPSAESSTASRQSRARRLIDVRSRSPALYKAFTLELKRSLEAASNVMEEEKSACSGRSSSTKSSLSNEELGNIARRAAEMSKSTVVPATSMKESKQSPLSQMKAFKKTCPSAKKVSTESRNPSPFKPVSTDAKNTKQVGEKCTSKPTNGQGITLRRYLPALQSTKRVNSGIDSPNGEQSKANAHSPANKISPKPTNGCGLTQADLLTAASAFKPAARIQRQNEKTDCESKQSGISETKNAFKKDGNSNTQSGSGRNGKTQVASSPRLTRADRYAALLKQKGRGVITKGKEAVLKTKPERQQGQKEDETESTRIVGPPPSSKYGHVLNVPVRETTARLGTKKNGLIEMNDKTGKSGHESPYGYVSRFNERFASFSRVDNTLNSDSGSNDPKGFQPFTLPPGSLWNVSLEGKKSDTPHKQEKVAPTSREEFMDRKLNEFVERYRFSPKSVQKRVIKDRQPNNTPATAGTTAVPSHEIRPSAVEKNRISLNEETAIHPSNSMSRQKATATENPRLEVDVAISKHSPSPRGVFARSRKSDQSLKKSETRISPFKRGREFDISARSEASLGSSEKGFKYQALDSPGEDSFNEWEKNNNASDSDWQKNAAHPATKAAQGDVGWNSTTFPDCITAPATSNNSDQGWGANELPGSWTFLQDATNDAHPEIVEKRDEMPEAIGIDRTSSPTKSCPSGNGEMLNIWGVSETKTRMDDTAGPSRLRLSYDEIATHNTRRWQDVSTESVSARETNSSLPEGFEIQASRSVGSLTHDDEDTIPVPLLRSSPGRSIDVGESKPMSPLSSPSKFQSARSIFENASRKPRMREPTSPKPPLPKNSSAACEEQGGISDEWTPRQWKAVSVEEKVMSSMDRLYNAYTENQNEPMNPFSFSSEYASGSFPSTFDETAMETDPLQEDLGEPSFTSSSIHGKGTNPSSIGQSGTSDVSQSMLHGEIYTEDGSNLQYSSGSNRISSNEESGRISSATTSSSSQMSKSTASREEFLKTRMKVERLTPIQDEVREDEMQDDNMNPSGDPDEDPHECEAIGTKHSTKSISHKIAGKQITTDNLGESTTQDTLRWWQKKYAPKVGGETNSVVNKVFSRNGELTTFDIGKDEEEDVFSGLEEETKAQGSSLDKALQESKSSPQHNENHFEFGRSQGMDGPSTLSTISLEGFDSVVVPPPPPPPPLREENSHRSQEMAGRRSKTRSTYKKKVGTIMEVSESEISDEPKVTDDQKKKGDNLHSGMVIDGYGMNKVSSDITFSVIEGLSRRQSYSKKGGVPKIDETSQPDTLFEPEGQDESRLEYDSHLDSYSQIDSYSRVDSNSRLDSRVASRSIDEARVDSESRNDSSVESNSPIDSRIDSQFDPKELEEEKEKLHAKQEKRKIINSRLDTTSRQFESHAGPLGKAMDKSSESDSIGKGDPTRSDSEEETDDREIDGDSLDITYAESKDKGPSTIESTAAAVMSFGYAIVNSISSACKLTENLPKFSDFTQDSVALCTKKGEECAYQMGLDDPTDESTLLPSKSRTSVSPVMMLNDAEREKWDQWEERDDLSGKKNKQEKSQEQEENLANVSGTGMIESPRTTRVDPSSSSSLDSSSNRMHIAQRREQAQSKLLGHAKRAQELSMANVQSILSAQTEDTDTLSAEEKSLGSAITFAQQEVLQRLSSMLRNDKVEVLKLNRHGKWQVRYITVSKEVSWLKDKVTPPTPKSSQCPQALLWYKTHTTKHAGLAGLKNDGRGGFLFSQLNKIERDPNVNPPAPIPRKLKSKYSKYAGVKIRYHCDEGDRDILFCFQDKNDASAFCTAVNIIHQVVLRSADNG